MLQCRRKLKSSRKPQEKLPIWKKNVLNWRSTWRRLLQTSKRYLESTRKSSRNARSCSTNLKIWKARLESTAVLGLSRRLSWQKQKDLNLAAESSTIYQLPLGWRADLRITTSILSLAVRAPKRKSLMTPNVWFRALSMGIMFASSLMVRQDQERLSQYRAAQKCQVWHLEPSWRCLIFWRLWITSRSNWGAIWWNYISHSWEIYCCLQVNHKRIWKSKSLRLAWSWFKE